MKKEQFWQIIDETNRSMQDHDQETYFCRIVEALLHREREDILDWQEILNEYGRAPTGATSGTKASSLASTARKKDSQVFGSGLYHAEKMCI